MRRLPLCLWFGALAALLPRCPAAPQLRGGPMLECSGLPCMEVTIAGGKRLKMLIDTGNADTVIDRAKCKELGLAEKAMQQANGTVVAGFSTTTLTAARAGNAELGDLPVIVMDLQPDISKGIFPAADGVLAYTAFKDRLLKLDYKKRRVDISPPGAPGFACGADCGRITLPTFGKNGPPVVVTTGFAVNGRSIAVQVDTQFSGTLLIYPHAVERLGLTKEAGSAKKRNFPFTDGGVDMIESVANSESFGRAIQRKQAAIYFATPAVHLPDGLFDGTIGDGLLRNHVLLLDFHALRCRIL